MNTEQTTDAAKETTMKTPTIAAIEAASAKADNMHGVYTCEEMPCVPGKFYVERKDEDGKVIVYITSKSHCSCPAFAKAAVCKHQAFLNQCQRIEEEEALAKEYGALLLRR